MRIYKRNSSPKWWVTWNDQDGKRHRRSSGTSDKKLAEALAANWVKEGFLEEHFGKKPEVPFSEALLRYAKASKRDHPKSFEGDVRYRLKHLQAYFGGYMLSEISLKVIQDFMDGRLETVSQATAQKDASTLRAILNKAYREELMVNAPRFPKFKPLKPRDRWLTMEEEQKLLKDAPPHLVPIVRFAVDTGGRLSEVLGLDWREVDLSNRRIRFTDTKNGEDRTVRLCDRACSTLAHLSPKESGAVFTFRGKPIASVKKAFDKARSKAGLEDVRFHDLRHTFASRLVQGGVPLYDVMHLMGHKSLKMVQRYAHLAPDYQDRAIIALNALGHNLGTVEAPDGGSNTLSPWENGAGEEIRTLDPNLGKVVLYH